MIVIYLIFVIIFITNLRLEKANYNKEYISKDTTHIINGFFVITVFFSHFSTYINTNNYLDNLLNILMGRIGQLMVASFFFYSGYGIYESIKNKNNYITTFFKSRFIPTFINFSIAIFLFIILNSIMDKHYSIKTILLSFTGFTSIGNSNWYMLAIFYLYICTLISFNKSFECKDILRILLIIVLSCIYIFIIYTIKREAYYVNTILCYSSGMLFSYYKSEIESFIKRKYHYSLILAIIALGLFYMGNKLFPYLYIYTYNMCAICFIFIIVIFSMKFSIKNSMFSFFGKHVFWIYILQRIPMIIFNGVFNNNYLFFIVSFSITIFMSIIMKKMTDSLWTYFFQKKASNI